MPKIERKREGQGRIRFLTPAEEQTILSLMRQWGKDDHAEAVEVLIDTGFRNSELWALQGRDVDLKQGLIHVWRTKTDHPRSVYMTDRVQAILERRKELHGDGVLFPGMDNYTLRYVWDRARTQMGLDNDPNFVPYVCRHTCASRMVQRNVPIPVIKQWMGHKTVQMTMRYAHLAPTNLKAAAAALNQ
jgi:integrase